MAPDGGLIAAHGAPADQSRLSIRMHPLGGALRGARRYDREVRCGTVSTRRETHSNLRRGRPLRVVAFFTFRIARVPIKPKNRLLASMSASDWARVRKIVCTRIDFFSGRSC